MKSLLKGALARTPYKIVRRTKGNRFSAGEEALRSLRARGFAPKRIIDGGANVGEFSKFVLELFPEATIHAVEPQPGCQKLLRSLAEHSRHRLQIHAVALCSPEEEGGTLRMLTDSTSTSTGAHVTISSNPSTDRGVDVPSITLDNLLATFGNSEDRALLKLDLQGYELRALRGAIDTLSYCDVVLCEVSFYAQAYEPPISELVAFLDRHGFELYDIASIYARPRDDRPRQGDFIFVKRDSPLMADTGWS